ncbi:MAG: CoA transferase [Alphaproteobacteria bacterium]|nr:CoA transferase [Alphaproteobacteria bacterium]MBU0798187.1 CoA transferase [Alphaproteobacteria bacterium]MBU0887595.1 CoA transferase [Alphaproteobacteria bacterium]MBU1814246.1 CoA transferase [Alphaproteobacteria bacterium]MBU2090544.1 CoA transferase [Alphaproteobacteria bacterium]
MTAAPTPDQAPCKTGALAGIRVLDLTSVILGPYATQILGDHGADIIKVEAPEGDVLRGTGPARNPGMGAIFLNSNRNKRSLVLDLKQPAARDALLRLVAGADVFVHSLRPKAIARLGFDYAAVRAANPSIIYCSAWGFGSGGPYADRPAYDDIIQAMSGVADLARRQSGTPEPAYAPTVLADKTVGQSVANALLAALLHRERTGRGQEVEVPMFENLSAFMLLEHLAGAVFMPEPGEAEGEMGYQRLLAPHRRPYRTSDGFVTVLPYTTKQWRSFFLLAGQPEMAEDSRITDPGLRSRSIGDLYGLIADLMPARSTADWLAALEEADIPAARVNSLEDMLDDPHLQATGFFQEMAHPSEGRLRALAPASRLSDSPQAIHCGAPRLGEHSREILAEGGFSSSEIDGLIASGASVQAG